MRTLAGRYTVEDRVLEGDRWSLWRAFDTTLRRPVGVVAVAADHPALERVLTAARAAAHADDPRLQRVLDVLPDGDGTSLVVEWVNGTDLEVLLADGALPEALARRMLAEAAWALAHAHDHGLWHGRLAPRWLLLTDDNRVRLGGVELAAALTGSEEAEEVRDPEEDVRGLGRLLYAALTCRWPGGPGTCALPPAPIIGGQPVRPRQVRAGVPPVLDGIVARALSLDHRGERLHTPAEFARALEAARPYLVPEELDHELPLEPTQPVRRRNPGPLAVGAVVLLTVLAAAGGALGLRSVAGGRPEQARSTTSTSASASDPALAPVPLSREIPIVRVTDFDPDGNGSEHPDEVMRAVDGNAGTAWRTLSYTRPNLGGLKPGVGLLLDLGHPTEVVAVRLELVGRGTDVELRVSNTAPKTADDAITVARATGAGDLVTLLPDPSVRARYVLVWLTRLPPEGAGYRGGIAEVQVLRG